MTDAPLTQEEKDALRALGATNNDIATIPPDEGRAIIRNNPPKRAQENSNGGGATSEPDRDAPSSPPEQPSKDDAPEAAEAKPDSDEVRGFIPSEFTRTAQAAARNELEPNLDQLEIYIEAMFRHCDPNGVVSLRSFYQSDTSKAFSIKPVPLQDGLKSLIATAMKEARRAAKVSTPVAFTPPVATFKAEAGWQAREEDLLEGPVLSVELDENPRVALAKLEHLLAPATLVVRSGGQWTDPTTGKVEDKLHAYWRLKKPAQSEEQLDKLKELRRLATMLVGADRTNIPVNHPIRWPGSWHRKTTPRLCEIISPADQLDNEIDLDEASAILQKAAGNGPVLRPTPGLAGGPESGDQVVLNIYSKFAHLPPMGLDEGMPGAAPHAEPERIAAALAVIPNSKRLYVLCGEKIDGNEDDALDWHGWNYTGMASWRATNGAAEGFAAFDAWSKKSTAKYNARITAERWAHYFTSPPTQLGAGTIFYLADQASPGWREKYEARKNNDQHKSPTKLPPPEERSPPGEGGDGDGGSGGGAGLLPPPPPPPGGSPGGGSQSTPLPPPTTLAEVHGVFQRWLGNEYELATLDATLAAAAAELLPGDPAWLIIISGSANAKTETVQSTSMLKCEVVSTIASEGALLSAWPRSKKAKNATGGLLRKIGPRGILVIKDFTSILSSDRNTRAQVLAALREIYDGRWVRNVGTDGGKTLEWQGRIVVIGACTTAWDAAHAVIAIMGDRFVLIRSNSHTGRIAAALRAIRNTGKETAMRAEMATAVAGLIGTVDANNTYPLTPEDETAIINATNLVTLARTGVETDYRGDIIDAHDPEMPTRLSKQLTQIMRGALAIGMPPPEALRLALRCARDSVPQLRLAILLDLASHPDSRVIEIRRRLQRPRMTIDRTLQGLHTLGLLYCREEEEERGGRTVQIRFYSLAAGVDTNVLNPP